MASLGLCGITSKKHNNNSGSSGIGGDGTNESSGRISESYKTEYQNLVTPNDIAIATKSNSSSKWREMKSDDVDVDSCYICDDGGGMFKLPCLIVLSLLLTAGMHFFLQI